MRCPNAGAPAAERRNQSGVWVMDIIHDSAVDGEGLRTVIFCAGCPHQCAGCHNPESWSMRRGRLLVIEDVVNEAGSNPLTDITLSGGDPFIQAAGMVRVAGELRRRGKHIWAYTGYTLDALRSSPDPDQRELLACCDVLVDGRFELSQRDLSLSFRGSRNQHIWKQSQGNWEDVSHVYSKP